MKRRASYNVHLLAGLDDADVDRIMGVSAALAQLSAASALGGLSDVGDLAGMSDFLKAFKKAVTPSNWIKGQLKKAGDVVAKNAGSILKIAGPIVTTMFPAAGAIIGPLTKLVAAGAAADPKLKAAAVEQVKKNAAVAIAESKAAQTGLLKVTEKVAADTTAAKMAGKPVPKTIVVEKSAVVREGGPVKVDPLPVKKGPGSFKGAASGARLVAHDPLDEESIRARVKVFDR